MELLVKYKDGSTRRVALHPIFFTDKELSIAKRALDFAYHGGKDPYYVSVYRGNFLAYENRIPKNKPEFSKPAEKIDEFLIKKELRNQFKKIPFKGKEVLQF